MEGIVEEFVTVKLLNHHLCNAASILSVNLKWCLRTTSYWEVKADRFISAPSFPAKKEYHVEIGAIGKKIAEELKRLGVLGRFAVDFMSVKQPNGWKHYPDWDQSSQRRHTHPFIMLQYLTDGVYIWQEGAYMMADGQTRSYVSSDNVQSEKYKGLTPHDLIDIAMCNHILYDGAKQTGVMFHMIGALSEFGKLGMVCIGKSVEEANEIYRNTIAILDKECG